MEQNPFGWTTFERRKNGLAKEDGELIVLRTPEEVRAEYLRKLAGFRIIDDTFARPYFKNSLELAQFVLRIITGLRDIEIDPTEYETQFDAKRLVGSRSLILDVHAGDRQGRKYDLEMEKSDASPARREIHVATMVTEHLNEGDAFSDLPVLYVIFVCEHDEVGNGRPVNEFMYINTDRFKGDREIESKIKAHESMGGRTHILVVNGDYKDNTTEIGQLIHDLQCVKAGDMFFENLAKKMSDLKETKEGVETVCAAMEEEKRVSNKENTLQLLLNLMRNKEWDADTAMDALGIDAPDRDLYARSARFALGRQSAAATPVS